MITSTSRQTGDMEATQEFIPLGCEFFFFAHSPLCTCFYLYQDTESLESDKPIIVQLKASWEMNWEPHRICVGEMTGRLCSLRYLVAAVATHHHTFGIEDTGKTV